MDKAFSQNHYVNPLAKELLIMLGNAKPSRQQMDLAKRLVSKMTIDCLITFDSRLTLREISCLYLAAFGKTAEETAELLCIKSSTVDTHRREIKRKLHCDNIGEAIFKGIRYGYVSPIDKRPLAGRLP